MRTGLGAAGRAGEPESRMHVVDIARPPVSRVSRVRAVTTAALIAALTAGLPAAGLSAAPAAQAAVRQPAAVAGQGAPAFNFGWKQAPAHASLSGISCLSASDCMAVGTYTDPLGHQHSTAQRWNGSRWRVLDLVPGTGLAEVSCTSTTFCMAVGSVIDRWTGHTWERLQSEKGQSLSGVACTSATFCMAAGTSSGDMGNVSEAWN